jgi:hypothetical protein
LVADIGFGALQRAITPRGLRRRAGPLVGGADVESNVQAATTTT